MNLPVLLCMVRFTKSLRMSIRRVEVTVEA